MDSCKEICTKDACPYSEDGQKFRIRRGYCPIIDLYFDPEKQEEYEKSKLQKGRRRIGQQKQQR